MTNAKKDGIKDDSVETKAAKAEDKQPSNSTKTMREGKSKGEPFDRSPEGTPLPARNALSVGPDRDSEERRRILLRERRQRILEGRALPEDEDPAKLEELVQKGATHDRPQRTLSDAEVRAIDRQGVAVSHRAASSTRGKGWNVLDADTRSGEVRVLVTNRDTVLPENEARALAKAILTKVGDEPEDTMRAKR